LRLCFGHAGGEEFWFRDTSDERRSFGEQVVELCLTYRNVYCETGYLVQVLDPKSVPVMQRRMASQIGRLSRDGSWKLGDKLMYGTDWSMIATEREAENYLTAYWRAFGTDELKSWRSAFFAGNAVRFLRLRDVADRADAPYTPAQREYWRALAAQLDPNGAVAAAGSMPCSGH
jgi:predicted TIM-barrel fold metal-dependent hydrolase